VFTARYALSPYIKQIRFVFKGLINIVVYLTDFLYILLIKANWDNECQSYKAVPLQAWTSAGGSIRLRILDFKTVGT
jgi:hypothetical protein